MAKVILILLTFNDLQVTVYGYTIISRRTKIKRPAINEVKENNIW